MQGHSSQESQRLDVFLQAVALLGLENIFPFLILQEKVIMILSVLYMTSFSSSSDNNAFCGRTTLYIRVRNFFSFFVSYFGWWFIRSQVFSYPFCLRPSLGPASCATPYYVTQRRGRSLGMHLGA